MQKWEYQTITLKRNLNLLTGGGKWEGQANLSQMGEDGWELVTVVPIADPEGNFSGMTHQLQYIFKRAK